MDTSPDIFKAEKSEAISPKKRIILREFCWENHVKSNCFEVQIALKWILGTWICGRVQACDCPVVGRSDSDEAVSGWILPKFRVLRIWANRLIILLKLCLTYLGLFSCYTFALCSGNYTHDSFFPYPFLNKSLTTLIVLFFIVVKFPVIIVKSKFNKSNASLFVKQLSNKCNSAKHRKAANKKFLWIWCM